MNDEQHKFFSGELDGSATPRRVASFAFSIVVHAAIIATVVYFAAPLPTAHRDWVLAYLVEIGNGPAGAGNADASAPASASAGTLRLPTPHRAEPRKPAPAKSYSSSRPAMKRPQAEIAEPQVASREPEHRIGAPEPDLSTNPHAPNDSSTGPGSPGGGASGTGGAQASTGRDIGSGSAIGTGSGLGDGTGDAAAHADYGNSPPPRYPVSARRHEQQGTVTLRVQVGADGSVERVEIADSSGVAALDDAAVETVRARWRFVPAHRGAVAFESWVLVPIRFALTEASASR